MVGNGGVGDFETFQFGGQIQGDDITVIPGGIPSPYVPATAGSLKLTNTFELGFTTQERNPSMATNNSSTSNTIRNLTIGDIMTVNVEGDVIEAPVSTSQDVVFGGLTIRGWNNNLHVIYAGENAEGKTPVTLNGPQAVFGLFNALVKMTDHPEMFDVLTMKHHIYASAAKRSYAEAAGYVLVVEIDNELDLPVNVWHAVRRENNAFVRAGAIRYASYNEARTWKTQAARNENEHKQKIVALHNGFNTALQLLAGEISVNFKTFTWSEGSKSVLADKKFAMASNKEYRDSLKEDLELLSAIKEVMVSTRVAASKGKLNVSQNAPASYHNTMLEVVECEVSDLVGKMFYIVMGNGSRLGYNFGINSAEDAAARMAIVRSLGAEAYLQEVEG